MGLTGERYTAHTWTGALTADDPSTGRWVAVDESGWDGEQLHCRERRHLVLGRVAIDDIEASGLLGELRRECGVQSVSEMKFRLMRADDRSERLSSLLLSQELKGRCSVYIVDKEYCAVAKIVDLLEDQAYEAGQDLISGGKAREMARTLFAHGPRALGQDRFSRLIEAFVKAFSSRGRKAPDESLEGLYDEIERCWSASTRKTVSDLLRDLRSTRPFAKDLHLSGEDLPSLEMLIPSLTQLIRSSRPLGRVRFLVDEQRAFTDDVLGMITRAVSTVGYGTSLTLYHPDLRAVDLRDLLRGQSSVHPSLQLADLLAGAGGLVMNTPRGTDKSADALRSAVVPLIAPSSLLPSEDLSVFA